MNKEKKMNKKETFYFISLKIIEIAGVIFLPYFVGKFCSNANNVFIIWIVGILFLIALSMIIILLKLLLGDVWMDTKRLIMNWIETNKGIAKRLAKK